MLSHETRAAAQRFQDLAAGTLTTTFLDDERLDPMRWPFTKEEYAIVAALSFAVALRLMLAYTRRTLGASPQANAEIGTILAYASVPIEEDV